MNHVFSLSVCAAAMGIGASAVCADILLDQGTTPDGTGYTVGGLEDLSLWTVLQPFEVTDEAGWTLGFVHLDGWVAEGDGVMVVSVLDGSGGDPLAQADLTFTNTDSFASDFVSVPMITELPAGPMYSIRIEIQSTGNVNSLFLGNGAGLESVRIDPNGREMGGSPIAIVLEGFIGTSECAADCDQSGGLNTLDFLCFLNAFNNGDGYADYNGDGTVNTLDFLAYLNDFSAGCE